MNENDCHPDATMTIECTAPEETVVFNIFNPQKVNINFGCSTTSSIITVNDGCGLSNLSITIDPSRTNTGYAEGTWICKRGDEQVELDARVGA